jgi:hypothetical protein
MIGNAIYLSNAFSGGAIPAMLLVDPAHAWLLLVLLLTFCCAALGVLTTHLARSASGDHAPTPPRPRQRHRPRSSTRLRPGRLAMETGSGRHRS